MNTTILVILNYNQMMKLLMLTLLSFSFSSFAYPPKSMDMTEYEYRRYVRPQLKSILQDYQTLLLLLNPEFKPIKKSFSDMKLLLKLKLELKDNCSGGQVKSCIIQLQKAQDIIASLKKTSNTKVDLLKKEYLTIDEKLKSQKIYGDYQNHLLKAQTSIENLILDVTLVPPKSLYLRVHKDNINKVITSFYLFTTEASDNRFKNDLNGYWSNFVMPVYKFVIVKDEKEYFIHNINEFNIRWNSLNVRLSKRGKVVSKQVKTLINIMHNRWNRILKITLNPMKY